jgi:hypothetical protein
MKRIALFIVCLVVGCNKCVELDPYKKEMMILHQQSGVDFPVGATVLKKEDAGRKEGEYVYWILYCHDPFDIHGNRKIEIDAETSREVLEKLLPDEDFGEMINSRSLITEWDTPKYSFRATKISTSKGFYFEIERFRNKN